MKPKVLHLNLKGPTLPNNGWKLAFENNGYEYHEFDYMRVRFDEGVDGMWQRVFGLCIMYEPDLIFAQIQNDELIDEDVAKQLSSYAFTVLYNFDIRQEVQWMEEVAPHVGLVLFNNYLNINQLLSKGITNVDYLQCSADSEFYHRVETDKNYGEIIFIGNNYVGSNLNFPLSQERYDMVQFLKKEYGERFQVYGAGWENSRVLLPEEEREAYSSCKVAITHNQFSSPGYTSDRLFRGLFCGTHVISQNFIAKDSRFLVHIPVWNEFIHLKSICDTLLFHVEHNGNSKSEDYMKLLLKFESQTDRVETIVNKVKVYELFKQRKLQETNGTTTV